MKKSCNIYLIGPMGAGKSTIGRHIAKKLKIDFYDSDQEVEERCGADITWIFDLEGEAGYREREMKVIDELTQLKNIVLATGGGTIMTPENREYLTTRGIVIYLRTTLEIQYTRTRYDAKRPHLHTKDVKGRLNQLWEERSPHYEQMADLIFDTDGRQVKSIANNIVDTLLEEELYTKCK